MPKLTDIQLIILSTAAKRKDGAPLPLPKSVRIKKEAAARILRSLVKHGAIAERPALRDDAAWRETEDGQRLTLVITDGGRQALGTLPDKGSKTRTAEAKSQQKGARRRTSRTTNASEPKMRTKRSTTTARNGTKIALLIELLKRKAGTTIDEIAKATNWQRHSVRGAISGALKRKLGLTVSSKAINGRGQVYRIDVGR
jgi:Protein of unknown function (DUF3489)